MKMHFFISLNWDDVYFLKINMAVQGKNIINKLINCIFSIIKPKKEKKIVV